MARHAEPLIGSGRFTIKAPLGIILAALLIPRW